MHFDEFWPVSPPQSSGCESLESRNSQLLYLLTAWPQAALGHSHCVFFAQCGVLKCELVSDPFYQENLSDCEPCLWASLLLKEGSEVTYLLTC